MLKAAVSQDFRIARKDIVAQDFKRNNKHGTRDERKEFVDNQSGIDWHVAQSGGAREGLPKNE